jgi:transposase InsO family protein
MIGPLPTAPGGFDRVLVAIDKFTKWIEVKPVTCPKADRVLDFLDELVHRYGLPNRIIIDLGSNFNNHQFWEYCENSRIDVRYVSVAHPRANGQVERANGMVLDALKKRLHDAANSKGGKWIRELPNALWGLRTQPSKPTGQSPYFWFTAPKKSSLLMSCGTHQQWSTTTKACLKTADELTSTDSKKLAAPPSSNQQGT